MMLRDEVHRSIDELDSRSLALTYEHIRLIQRVSVREDPEGPVPTREEVLRLTASDTSNWADDICAEREDRV